MKRILLTILSSVMILSVVGCSNTNETKEDKTKGDAITYKDGTYVAQGEKRQHGSEEAEVVIKEGKISEITLKRLDAEGKEVDYSLFNGKEVEGKGTMPNLDQYRKDIAKEMIEKQTYEVDTISGATQTIDNWEIAVKDALTQAKK